MIEKTAALLIGAAMTTAAAAQQMQQHGTQAPGTARTATLMSQVPSHDGMDMNMNMMSMQAMLGRTQMQREGSGTNWQPEATPIAGRMAARGDWTAMINGFVYLITDRQTGPRGDDKVFAQSMGMLMAQ